MPVLAVLRPVRARLGWWGVLTLAPGLFTASSAVAAVPVDTDPGSRALSVLAASDAAAAWGVSPPELDVQFVGERSLSTTGSSASAALSGRVAATLTGPEGTSRIVVDAAEYAGLTEVGRRVVLTHEATHVLTRPATPAGFPLWLSEGFADQVAFSAAGVPVKVAAGRVLATAVDPMPGDERFEGPDAELAYEASYLTCRYLADRFGEARLVQLYEAVAARIRGSGALDDAFLDTLGVSYAQLRLEAASAVRGISDSGSVS